MPLSRMLVERSRLRPQAEGVPAQDNINEAYRLDWVLSRFEFLFSGQRSRRQLRGSVVLLASAKGSEMLPEGLEEQ